MNKFLFALLAALSFNASADNFVSHVKADGSTKGFMTYEAQDMKRSAENNWMYVIYRNCQKLSAEQLIKREKLAPNNNIVGGFYCGKPNGSTYILIKDLHQIRDNVAVVVK